MKFCQQLLLLAAGFIFFTGCNNKPAKDDPATPTFLTAKEIIRLNQLIYKKNTHEALTRYAPGYEAVFIPRSAGGNYAIIAKSKTANEYALVIRGSMIEFSNEGFQNFVLQDFNIFTIKKWDYTDTVKEAYISNGAWIGFQNLLQLKDTATGLAIKEFIEQKIPDNSTLVITGHSLGGNLSYPMAGYLKNELPANKKNLLQLITFGAPAAGNAAFVQDLEEKFPDAERYVTDKDIAPVFPDTEKISAIARLVGLDSVLQMGKLNISGYDTGLDAGKLLDFAGELLEKTNVINKTNKYVQSQKHLRLLTITDTVPLSKALTTEAIFGNAYRYHQVNVYAEKFGVGAID